MKEYAIIVAGGTGKRMGADLPKQFLILAGKPVLQHTLEAFYHYNPEIRIIVSLHPSYEEYWKNLCRKQNIKVPHTLVQGGETRFFSVKNALKEVNGESLVAVHDAVRPFIRKQFLQRLFEEAKIHGNAVPVLPLRPSLRKITEKENTAVSRENYFTVQTPQIFHSEILLKAYRQDFDPAFTDDASVVEKINVKIHTTQGLENNIKLTSPFDMKLAQCLLAISNQ